MIDFVGRAILLDIEGTTSSISFVYDVLFPYALRHLVPFLERHWGEPETAQACECIARDAGAGSFADWTAGLTSTAAQEKLFAEVQRLVAGDVKATGLKELQGLIWREGYQGGELKSHVYPDVMPALQRWTKAGLVIAVYSSGSVLAQKQFFAHTEQGDLTPFFRGHYDTTTGPKREARSYTTIASDLKSPPSEILFCSDVVAELDAAAAAGLQTVLVVRPGNPPAPAGHQHPVVTSLMEIRVGE